jgi:uncharacterized membrane protein YbhN (UPF0104 family)
MADSPSRLRHLLGFTAKLAISAAILIWLFGKTDLSDVWRRARHADALWVVAALGLYGLMILISAWRWRLLLEAQGAPGPMRRLTGSWLVATFFNNFLPSNIGGDVIRVADSVQLTRSRTAAATVVLVDRAIGLAALLVVAAAGTWLAARNGIPVPASNYVWIAALGAVLAGLPTLVWPQVLGRVLSPLAALHPELVGTRVDRFVGTVERLGADPARLWQAIVGALVVQVVLVAYHLAIAHAIGTPLAWDLGLVIVPVSLVMQMAPVSVNGFGVREAVFSYFFARLGLPADAALALSLMSAALIMLFSLSGGLVFLVRRHKPLPQTPEFAGEEA